MLALIFSTMGCEEPQGLGSPLIIGGLDVAP